MKPKGKTPRLSSYFMKKLRTFSSYVMWEFFLRRREDQRKGSRKSSILSSKCKLCFKTKKAKITVTSYKQLSTWRPKSLMTSKVCWALKSISLSINLQNPLRLSMKGFPILRNRLKSFRLQLTLFTLSWMIKLAVLQMGMWYQPKLCICLEMTCKMLFKLLAEWARLKKKKRQSLYLKNWNHMPNSFLL